MNLILGYIVPKLDKMYKIGLIQHNLTMQTNGMNQSNVVLKIEKVGYTEILKYSLNPVLEKKRKI